jgi:hypothetical protein
VLSGTAGLVTALATCGTVWTAGSGRRAPTRGLLDTMDLQVPATVEPHTTTNKTTYYLLSAKTLDRPAVYPPVLARQSHRAARGGASEGELEKVIAVTRGAWQGEPQRMQEYHGEGREPAEHCATGEAGGGATAPPGSSARGILDIETERQPEWEDADPRSK